MARFFIHRPVFAWVLAIITMLAGVYGLSSLPIAQYPDIAPTTVRISATYTGASPDIVENSVTSIIEDGMTGLDGLIYMTSTSSQGSSSIQLTFDDSVDPDIAQVQVQNKLQLVTSQLPESVQSKGVSVSRSTSSILLVGALTSTDGSYSSLELGDLVAQVIENPVKRTAGVGSINSFGSGYAMRIWLDPDRMLQYQVTPSDVVSAVSEQNTNVTLGSLGSQPTVKGQQLNVALSAQSQLTSVREFERILLRTDSDGATIFLGDVADIEIGQEDYGSSSRYNGMPAAGFGVNLATGANAVDTAEAVREVLDGLQSSLPAGVQIVYPYDTSPFVEESINQVYHTLIEAVVLVFLVILVFLQSWRATLIPTLAIPVVLLGTFGVLSFAGMSINTLTMFAMVLAIGLLVDDAIVVVENVERVMEEESIGPVEATEKSMDEISSALVGIVLVLSAVFLPMAFMSGSTGVIYRQFSVTIITAMVLSLGVALILTPAMCATLLRPRGHGDGIAPARWFNRNLDRATNGYAGAVGAFVRRPFRFLVVLLAFGAGAYMLYQKLPGSFLPSEDQGVLMVMVETPEGSTAERTRALVEEVEQYVLGTEKDTAESVFAALGFGFGGSGPRNAMIFVKLKDFELREGFDAASMATRGNLRFMENRNGQVFFMQPPAIQGMGNTAGFTMHLIDQSGHGQEALAAAADELVEKATADGRVTSLQGNDAPFETSRRIDIDQQKAAAYGLSISDLNTTLSVIFASANVNDFSLGTELRPVIVQGKAEARMQPDDIEKWYVRNTAGDMVPFTAFTAQDWDQQAQSLARYGGTRSLEVTGAPAQGVSSGTAMEVMEELVAGMDGGYGTAWTGLSYQERLSGSQAPMLFALSALVVFLALAALYESWSVPLSVMMTVPIGIVGAMAAALVFDQSNDVYFKVGLLTTIGLAARNAILIVEFAQQLHGHGKPLLEAAVEASRMRLRPILMTTLAFMLGVLPLALASGAGAAAQQSIGIGVLGGITASAVIGIFLVAVFYVAVLRAVQHFTNKRAKT
ncbi:efflux RND transporter permease subunit [Paracoccus denitrificans]|jgi:multidrug efflux pump|uniref:Efflux pump membrane transporter n=1 Tax=Paracoccus denitrificans (strain Pd 1222) TaxID=318586 RepID=A1B7M5_PARDP|nr:efflux RND transporter permease subunit [Paracoccus denitrificans]ABL71519.1 transporter, hydrophobe/amphiphile efflux-1 (HAE1) family [Paracoccus denitrificans PD1222]MBB4630129.1 multidrug efflux pump [Paracoccus denitrificans]MCU7431464.1 efflux RND transporter permease subunit [Paracoccus denitrificans]QAR28121.1 multidrug efflux RND transporter permease subunit [Paracoccus denitrificans]UPV97848.1 efflux RND transporter permease subunit [Paracoccus denitrificans]